MSSQQPLRILQITDTHVFRDQRGKLLGIKTGSSVTDVIDCARQQFESADLIICTGDLVHDHSEVGYQLFKEIFSQFSCPVIVMPGNHDAPEMLYRVLQGGNMRPDMHNIIGDWQFISLNSAVPGKDHGFISEDELDEMDALLTANPALPTLVCLHHQPVEIGSKWMDAIGVQNKADLWAVLRKHACVKGVVWGHIHQAFEAEVDGIQLRGTPSTCVQFKPQTEGFAVDIVPPGYRWLRLASDGSIESDVVRLNSVPEGLDVDSWGYE